MLSPHLHEGNSGPVARKWWASALQLENPESTKTYVKLAGTGHRKNHLAHGVCKVRLRRSANAWFRTMAWIDALAVQLGPAMSPEA